MAKRITIKDLAKKMDLSYSTISRALQNHPGISKPTIEKVKKMAEELGYTPNLVAVNLRSNKSYTIGIIVPRIDVHFHSRVISGIEDTAYKLGYNVTIYQSNNSLQREIAITKTLQKSRVDGVIACPGLHEGKHLHFEKFKKQNVPIVLYDRVAKNLEFNTVSIDDYEAAYMATEHLIKLGRKRIAHIAGNLKSSIFRQRLKGYKDALAKHNLLTSDDMVEYTSSLNYREGTECANRLLKNKKRPDGLFCANDYTAVSAIQAFMKANYNVPKDIAVVGFSNYPISEIIEPTLTTIDDKAFEMGYAASKLLIRQIEEKNRSASFETIVLKTNLIQRHSTDVSIS